MKLSKDELRVWYERSAQDAFRGLKPEIHADSPEQARLRRTLLWSMDLIEAESPAIRAQSEVPIRYASRSGIAETVVPDIAVLLGRESRPHLVIDLASTIIRRKDYEGNEAAYESGALAIPFYLRIDVEVGDLALFRRGSRKYLLVKPDAMGRLMISDLEMGVAMIAGLVRLWHRGRLIPTAVELRAELERLRRPGP